MPRDLPHHRLIPQSFTTDLPRISKAPAPLHPNDGHQLWPWPWNQIPCTYCSVSKNANKWKTSPLHLGQRVSAQTDGCIDQAIAALPIVTITFDPSWVVCAMNTLFLRRILDILARTMRLNPMKRSMRLVLPGVDNVRRVWDLVNDAFAKFEEPSLTIVSREISGERGGHVGGDSCGLECRGRLRDSVSFHGVARIFAGFLVIFR